MRKIKLIPTIIILVISAALSFGLSFKYASRSFTPNSQGEELLTGTHEYQSDGVIFDVQSGNYEPQGDDPWIAFDGLNVRAAGVLVTLGTQASSDIETKLYWIGAGEMAYSEYHTVESRVCKGQTTSFLALPDIDIQTLRVDIDGACNLKKLTLLSEKPKTQCIFIPKFRLAFIIQFVLIGGVLLVAYMAHLDRIAKGSKPVAGLFVNEPKNPETYRYEYDWIRTLAAVMVIMMHSVVDSYAPHLEIGDPGYGVIKGILALSLGCNALYIMLSGALLLKPSSESFKDFYVKRLGRVLIPTLSYYLFSVIQGYSQEVFADGIGNGILVTLKGLLTGRPDAMPHMWFIYAIIALYILTPFLRKIIEHITEGQLFGLVVAGFVFDCFATYVPLFGGVEFGIDTPIAGWLGLFLLGYYMTTDHAKKGFITYMILGAVGVAVTVISVYYAPKQLYYESSWTPVMWLVGAGVFAFFGFFKKFFGKKNIVIASVAKYNFSIMLVHVFFLFKVVLPVGWRLVYDYGHLRWCLLGMIGSCFVLSYLFSLIYENTAIIAANYIYGKITKK